MIELKEWLMAQPPLGPILFWSVWLLVMSVLFRIMVQLAIIFLETSRYLGEWPYRKRDG
jgi:hypothetical protein